MIGQVITSILTGDSGVTSLVGTRIYAILMEENTHLPAISYTITELDATYAKSTWSHDVAHFQIRIFARSYAESNAIASTVRNALELKAGTYASTIKVDYILFEGYEEEYDLEGDSYSIVLNFRTNIRQY